MAVVSTTLVSPAYPPSFVTGVDFENVFLLVQPEIQAAFDGLKNALAFSGPFSAINHDFINYVFSGGEGQVQGQHGAFASFPWDVELLESTRQGGSNIPQVTLTG